MAKKDKNKILHLNTEVPKTNCTTLYSREIIELKNCTNTCI